MIYYKRNKRPLVYNIYDDFDSNFIGHLYLKNEGAVITYPSSVYRKLDAFGLHKDVLTDETAKFKWVIAKYKGEGQFLSRTYMLEIGVEEKFNFGVKVFVPRKYWIRRNNHANDQLSLPFEGGEI